MVDSVYQAATKAYQSALKNAPQAKPAVDAAASIPIGPQGGTADATPKLSFPQLVEGAVDRSIKTTYHGEEMTIRGLMNKADMHEVVAAVTQAELTLQAVVAVRDRVINAYQDILKMPI